jgi:hypothetical protein
MYHFRLARRAYTVVDKDEETKSKLKPFRVQVERHHYLMALLE